MVEAVEILAQHLDTPGDPLVEPDDRAQEDGFARARRPDKAHHLAAPHIEIEIFQHRQRAERDGNLARLDDDAVLLSHIR